MKKIIVIIISAILCMVIGIFAFVFLVDYSVSAPENDGDNNTLTWVPEKSRFEDYKIEKDKVRFCYSIYFINYEDEALKVSLGAKFEQSELEGWFSPQDTDEYLDGLDEKGEKLYAVIKPKEKKRVKFWFKGKYIGGKVNNELSFPELIPVIQNPDD